MFSKKISKNLGHSYTGTEHILLALMREPDSIGVRMLVETGIDAIVVITTEAMVSLA